MKERIKKLRKALDLTQQEFGNRIGIKRNTIANYETGRNTPIDAVISLICREFNANESWLRTGNGEMFNPASSAAMEALARERGLTHSDYVLIEKFLNLKRESRLAVAEYMLEVAAALNSDNVPLNIVTTPKAADTDTEAAHYHFDLIMDEQRASNRNASQQKRIVPVEMSDDELHAELDRQLAEEKQQADESSVSGHGSSEEGVV